MLYYKGNQSGQTPGILPGPPPVGDYYWWEGGALWGTMIDYWFLTGDSTYNSVVMQSMLHQVGPGEDYMPPNVTASLGNDDQGFWGMTAMQAAEENFPNPPSDQPQWLALAQAVFNTQASPDRHDQTCNGGLRWQIPLSNNGYNYKNSIANGCFFNLGARLARYTLNETYARWADETWDWVTGVGFMDAEYNIYDGGHVEHNCTDINRAQFSYNNGVFALGAAYMYNYTDGDPKWKTRLDGLIENTRRNFFPEGVAIEIACEDHKTCTTDMLSFKGYVARWFSTITQIAPYTAPTILPMLRSSAAAAVNQCVGGANARTCGFKWASNEYDGTQGAGQQMNVLGRRVVAAHRRRPRPRHQPHGRHQHRRPQRRQPERRLPQPPDPHHHRRQGRRRHPHHPRPDLGRRHLWMDEPGRLVPPCPRGNRPEDGARRERHARRENSRGRKICRMGARGRSPTAPHSHSGQST